jgi:hypothetical protein
VASGLGRRTSLVTVCRDQSNQTANPAVGSDT